MHSESAVFLGGRKTTLLRSGNIRQAMAAMVAKKGIKMHIHFFEYIIFAKKNYSPS
jgi:hypothetical protein